MAENKTQPIDAAVDTFLDGAAPDNRRADARAIDAFLRSVTGEMPKMWGKSIVGYGSYHYRYESGREGDMCRIGFSPRKAGLVLYLVEGFAPSTALLDRLGKHTTGTSCLYIKALSDVDLAVLEELVRASLADIAERYPKQA